MTSRITLLLVLLGACAQPHSGVVAPSGSTLLVDNQWGVDVKVFDGPRMVASLSPSEHRIVTLFPNDRERTLQVSSAQGTAQTQSERFQEGSVWSLVISPTGRALLSWVR